MESFEIIVKKQSYKVIRDDNRNDRFNVFNHSTFYIIKKNNFEIWEKVEHRFGTDSLPIDEVGDAIDNHYHFKALQGLLNQG